MNPRRRRLVVVLLMVLATAGAAALLMIALQRNLTYLYTPTQVHQGLTTSLRQFRLGGIVQPGSLQYRPGTTNGQFLVTDGQNAVRVIVTHPLPDLFREGQATVASGTMVDDAFMADQVLARHDETYTPQSRTLQMRLTEQPTGHQPAMATRAK